MGEPHLDPNDWLGIAATSILTGIGSAMAWFNGKEKVIKRELGDRMATIELVQLKHADLHSTHKTELAVIHSNQDHLSSRLDELREGIHSMDEKLDRVLLAVRGD